MSSNLLAATFPSLLSSWPRQLMIAFAGSILIALSAKIHIPMWPVPMTMQTFAILFIAMGLGPVLGTGTVFLYLAEGALGLPVFSGTPERGIGISYMIGPTGGYLVGFFVSAALVAYLGSLGWGRSLPKAFLAMLLGTVTIFVCGYLWLAQLIGYEQAMITGVQPFLLGALLKSLLAAILLQKLWRLIERRSFYQ